MLCPWGSDKLFTKLDTPTSQNAIFAAAKEVIYTYVDTINFKNTAEKLVKTSLVGTKVETEEETTEIPTEVPTEVPTETPTEIPTEVTTEKTVDTTETPTEEKTEAPTEDKTQLVTDEITEATDGNESEKTTDEGCGSNIGFGAIAALSSALAAAFVFKKKKYEE